MLPGIGPHSPKQLSVSITLATISSLYYSPLIFQPTMTLKKGSHLLLHGENRISQAEASSIFPKTPSDSVVSVCRHNRSTPACHFHISALCEIAPLTAGVSISSLLHLSPPWRQSLSFFCLYLITHSRNSINV